MKLGTFFLVITVLCTSELAGAKPPSDRCQTNGPVTVCSQYGVGNSYSVYYQGYLYDRASPIHLKGEINGRKINDTRTYATGYKQVVNAGFLGAGNVHTDIELYFFNEIGDYDSVFGQNYHFQFH